MVDVTATDSNIRVALHLSSRGVAKDTLTATIDVTHRGTAKQYVAGIRVAQRLHLVTANLTIADIDTRITLNDCHLTTTEDAGTNLRVGTAHADSGVTMHIATMKVATGRNFQTHTAAIDAAIGVLNDTCCCNCGLLRCSSSNLRTDSTTCDGNRSGTTLYNSG